MGVLNWGEDCEIIVDEVWVWSQWFWVFGFFAVENIGGMLCGCAEEDEEKSLNWRMRDVQFLVLSSFCDV